MGYTKTEFGKLEDGTAVYRYTLTNEQGASASFTDLGGIWLTMVVPDRDGKMADVVLGYEWGQKFLSLSSVRTATRDIREMQI